MTLGPYALVLSFILEKAGYEPLRKNCCGDITNLGKVLKKRKDIESTFVYQGMKMQKQ